MKSIDLLQIIFLDWLFYKMLFVINKLLLCIKCFFYLFLHTVGTYVVVILKRWLVSLYVYILAGLNAAQGIIFSECIDYLENYLGNASHNGTRPDFLAENLSEWINNKLCLIQAFMEFYNIIEHFSGHTSSMWSKEKNCRQLTIIRHLHNFSDYY